LGALDRSGAVVNVVSGVVVFEALDQVGVLVEDALAALLTRSRSTSSPSPPPPADDIDDLIRSGRLHWGT